MNQKCTCLAALRLVGGIASLAFIVTVFTPLWNRVGESFVLDPMVHESDAIVVLGAGISADGALAEESLRRAVYGLQLYKRGMAPLLIVSGSPSRVGPFRSEGEIRKEIAIQMGVPGDRVVITTALTTREESMEVAALLAPRGAATVLLVTDSFHMRRAALVFGRTGLQVYPAPSDNLAHFAVTTRDRLYLLRRIVQEATGLVYYRLAGYI